MMASVGSNHSNSRLLGSSHDSRQRQCDEQEFEMRVPLQPHGKHENYENMDPFVDDPSHQYEDPGHLKGPKLPARSQRGTPRKKKNDVYEPSKRQQRRYTDSSSEDSYDGPVRRDPCWQCVRVMVFFIFFLALSALVLIGMIVLGYVPIKACGASCSPIEVPQEQAAASGTELSQMVKELSASVKELEATLKEKNDIIKKLQRRDAEQDDRITKLESQMPLLKDKSGKTITNLTAVVGPRGPPGFNGSRGPPGPKGLPGKANLSSCLYKVERSSAVTSGGSASVSVSEAPGEKILSASCSTEGASEYNLRSTALFGGTRRYICDCKGESTPFARSDGKSYCYIHYWTCPVEL